LASPFRGLALACWAAAPFAAFVPLLMASTTSTQHKCNSVVLFPFSFIAVAVLGAAVRPTDAFSYLAAWVVPAVLLVGATLAASAAALAGRKLARKGHEAEFHAQGGSR